MRLKLRDGDIELVIEDGAETTKNYGIVEYTATKDRTVQFVQEVVKEFCAMRKETLND